MNGQTPFVTVPITLMATLVLLHESNAAGGSKSQGVVQSTLLFGAQVSTGGVVSMRVTDWLQFVPLPQRSVMFQTRVATWGQVPIVVVLAIVITTFVPLHVSKAAGLSKLQAEPHTTVLSEGQVTIGG